MIRVLIPDMPAMYELVPYLCRMDSSKVYVNYGPIVRELEIAVAEMLEVERVATTSNGTTALELALRAMDLPRGSYVAVPAATFVATGLAVINAGLVPVLCDTQESSGWQLTPEHVMEVKHLYGKSVRAAVPVATFGVPVDASAWADFAVATDTVVVIDAAGALTTQSVPRSRLCAVSFSMHATKFVPAGEGGIVAAWDPDVVKRVEELASFGFGGTNARMSEYHAAVGLASMEKIPLRRLREFFLSGLYASVLPTWAQPLSARDKTLLVVVLKKAPAKDDLVEFMADNGVEVRQWYRPFLTERRSFKRLCLSAVNEFKGVADLQRRAFGLPFYTSLSQKDVIHVCEALTKYEGNFH